MQLPSVDEVNVTRLSRFDDRITAALAETERIDGFRDIVAHYVRHHDVPEQDVAAALAVVAQGDTPLLLDPAAEPRVRQERFKEDRGGDRPARGERPERRQRHSDQPMKAYKIQVGKRHKVEPRQIVGALANEGGLSREDAYAVTQSAAMRTWSTGLPFRETLREDAAAAGLKIDEARLDEVCRPERYIERLGPVFDRLAELT